MRAEIEHTQQSLLAADKVSGSDFTSCLPLRLVGFGSKETSCLGYILCYLCPFIPGECLSPPQVELRLSRYILMYLSSINRFQNSQNRYTCSLYIQCRCFTKQKQTSKNLRLEVIHFWHRPKSFGKA